MQLSRFHSTLCYGKARNSICDALNAPTTYATLERNESCSGSPQYGWVVLLNKVNLFTIRLVVSGNPAPDSALYSVLRQGS